MTLFNSDVCLLKTCGQSFTIIIFKKNIQLLKFINI